MHRSFSVEEARALMPQVLRRAATLTTVRADLAEFAAAVAAGRPSPLGGVAEAKALEARLYDDLGWFGSEGIQGQGLCAVVGRLPEPP